MNSFKRKVLVSFMAMALCVTSVFGTSTTTEAASSKKAVKSVTLKVGGKKVNGKTVLLTQGKSTTVKVTVNPSSAKKSITYKSSNKKIASISTKGKIKGVKAGTATMTVTVKGKNNKTKKATFKVIVQKEPTPTKAPTKVPTKKPTAVPTKAESKVTMTMSASATTIEPGQTAQLTVNFSPAGADKVVGFISSDTSVATVSDTGLVTAQDKFGKSTITAQSATGKIATLTITVAKNVPKTLELNTTSLTMTVGEETSQALVPVFDSEATQKDVTWTSSDTSVVTVVDGMLTAMKEGVATITVTSVANTSLSASCTVTVKAKTNDNVDGVSITVANSLKGYENTVFTGTNADIRVRVMKNGQPVGKTAVTLEMKHKSGDNYWYITNAGYTSTAYTDANGYAQFTIAQSPALVGGKTYTAVDGVMGGYLLTATATGSNEPGQAPLTFARFRVGNANPTPGPDPTNGYVYSEVTVNELLTHLNQADNAKDADVRETQTIDRYEIDTNDVKDSEKIGTTEYVVSQKHSKSKDDSHAVTFNAAPLIEYPEVITGTENLDYHYNVNYTSGAYTVYDVSQCTYVTKVPTNLNYAKIHFSKVSVSKHTAIKVELYKDCDENGYPVGTPIKTYAITGEHVESDFDLPIELQKLVSEKGAGDYVAVKIYLQSQGQVDMDLAAQGFSVDYIAGNYVETSTALPIREVYTGASIQWTQVQKNGGSDQFLYSSYTPEATMDLATANKYGIDTTNVKTVKYKMPVYPHIGDAYVTVTKRDSNEQKVYYLIPTTVKNNKTELVPSGETKAFRATEPEALNYVGTVTSDDRTVTLNSDKLGVTEAYGFVTATGVTGLESLEKRRLFTYVNWGQLPADESRNTEKFYALIGQTITVDVKVTDVDDQIKSDQEVELWLNKDLEDEQQITDFDSATVLGTTITKDSAKDDSEKKVVKTDSKGWAHIKFKSDSYKDGIYTKDLIAICKKYNCTMYVGGEKVPEDTYIKLYWVEPGLGFIDNTEVTKDMVDTDMDVRASKETVSYSASRDALDNDKLMKNLGTNWLIGYKYVGLVYNEQLKTKEISDKNDAEKKRFTNVEISGLAADVDLWKAGTNNKTPNGTELDVENKKKSEATIKLRSEKAGEDVIQGILNPEAFAENIIFTITDVDDEGEPEVITKKNVGKGTTTAEVGLNIPVVWKSSEIKYSVICPYGDKLSVAEGSREDTIYIRVEDEFGNPVDSYYDDEDKKQVITKLDLTVKNSANSDKVEKITLDVKNGYAEYTYAAPTEEGKLEFSATVANYTSKLGTITYAKRAESTVDFAMKNAKLSDDRKTVTITMTDKIRAATVDKNQFSVDDNLNHYEVVDVAVDKTEIQLTLKSAVAEASDYVNIKYSEVLSDMSKETVILSKKMVSDQNDAIFLENEYTVTAYTKANPKMTYADGTLTVSSGKLYKGAYVTVTYGKTKAKNIVVAADDTVAIPAEIAAYDDVVVYSGESDTK